MFKAVKARSIKEYFDSLPEDRRGVLESVHKLILEAAPSLKPNFLYNMPGYGSFEYTNSKKEILNWPVIALASQKNYVSLYVCAVENGEYIAEKHKGELGKVSVGRSCIRFKKLEDLNLEILKKIIKLAEKSPGLTGVGAH